MTPNDAAFTMIIELRIAVADLETERDALAAKNAELHAVIVERDDTITQLLPTPRTKKK